MVLLSSASAPMVVGGHVVVPLAAPVNLSRPGTYLHWHFLLISIANLGVILGMLALFALALLLPFPHGRRHHPDHNSGRPASGGADPAFGPER
ncbi:MAG: hypothetical protein ACYDAQ_15790 [Mycobacteriales bacterium]